MLPIKTILYPTDFSEESEPAFHLACDLGEHYGAHLVVLHVAPPPSAACYEAVMLPDCLDFEEQLRQKLCRIQPAHSSVLVVHCLVEGDPAEEILRKAKEIPCDLLVLGTHGRTGLKRLMLGSVAEQVVRKAPCPVLTVKPPFVAERAAQRAGDERLPAAPGTG